MPKFFVKTNQIEENKIKIIGEDVKHINQVLRAKIGEELTICNLDTTLNYITTISQITPEYVMCDIQDCVKSFVESNVQVTIFQGLPKADKMEYIIQKNTELGAKQIVPVEIKEFDAVILAYEEEKKNTLKNELKKLDGTKDLKIGIIIGPEGGMDKTEVEKLAKAGAKVVTLGKRILRTETASISIMSNIVYEFEL